MLKNTRLKVNFDYLTGARMVFLAILLVTFFQGSISNAATNFDGELNVNIGNQGYVDIENSLETWSRVYKLNNGSYVQFGSRRINNDSPNTCKGYASKPLLQNLTSTGKLINPGFGGDAFTLLNSRDSGAFTSIIQDKDGSLFISGYVNDISQINLENGNFNCSYDNYRSFLLKLHSNGSPDKTFGIKNKLNGGFNEAILYIDEIQSDFSVNGYISSLSFLTDKTLAITIQGNSNLDLIYLSAEDGIVNKSYGVNGKVSLENPDFSVHKSINTDNGILLAGDIINKSGDPWILRWGLTGINQKGNENLKFNGGSNFQYSTGRKEGIYVNPVFKAPYVYFVGGVLAGPIYEIKVMRINQNGNLDLKYGGYLRDQLFEIGIDPCSYCSGEFVVDNYGRVLVSIGTNSFTESGNRKSAIIRLDFNGKIDRTFGEAGKIWIDFEYQAGIYYLDGNDFLVYGSKYSPLNCSPSGKTCGLYKARLAQIKQNSYLGPRN